MQHTKQLVVAGLAAATALTLVPALAATAAPAAPAAASGQTAAVFCNATYKPAGNQYLSTGSTYSYVAGQNFKLKFKVKTKNSLCYGKVTVYDGKKKLKAVKVKHAWATYKLPSKLAAKKHKIKMVYKPSGSRAKGFSVKATVYKVKLRAYTAPAQVTGYVNNFVQIPLSVAYTGPTATPAAAVYLGAQTDANALGSVNFQGASASGTYRGTAQVPLFLKSVADGGTFTAGGTGTALFAFSPLHTTKYVKTISTAVTALNNVLTVTPAGGNPAAGTISPGNWKLTAPTGTTGACEWGINRGGQIVTGTVAAGQTGTIPVQSQDSKVEFINCLGGPTL
ncbi:MAG: hypothetical protein LBM66_01070 [Bifidobacteriaceae bacterium]|jgi:hypothetical protein|nr:hypothetical protein [Bifidobacteriaceae bacterium]